MQFHPSTAAASHGLTQEGETEPAVTEWEIWIEAQAVDHDHPVNLRTPTSHDEGASSPPAPDGSNSDIDTDTADEGEEHAYAKRPRSEPASSDFPTTYCELIREALRKPADEIVADGSITGLKICREDLAALEAPNWLTDNIMNVYLELIVNRNSRNPKLPKVFAFNTFFVPIYTARGYEHVRNWTKRDDIFAFDLLLIPVHEINHWTIIIVDHRLKQIKYMNSMGRRNDGCLAMMLTYLNEESRNKKGSEFNVDDWRLTTVQDLPQQKNNYDCGVFALKYADCAARDAEFNPSHPGTRNQPLDDHHCRPPVEANQVYELDGSSQRRLPGDDAHLLE